MQLQLCMIQAKLLNKVCENQFLSESDRAKLTTPFTFFCFVLYFLDKVTYIC